MSLKLVDVSFEPFKQCGQTVAFTQSLLCEAMESTHSSMSQILCGCQKAHVANYNVELFTFWSEIRANVDYSIECSPRIDDVLLEYKSFRSWLYMG